MAVEIIAVATATATSVTIPAHQAGDLLIISAIKWSSSSPTPTVPAGWTSAHTRTTVFRGAVGYRYATAPGTTSGTWTSAADLWVVVVRGATIGAVASGAGDPTVSTPALTLTSPPSVVLSIGTASDAGAAGTPAGMTSVWESSGTYRSKVSVTPAPVSSWSSVAVSNQDTSVVIELIPTDTTVEGSVTLRGSVAAYLTGSVTLRGNVAGYLGGSVTLRGNVLQRVQGSATLRGRILQRVQGSATLRGRVLQRVEGSVTLWGQIQALGTWHEIITSPRYLAAMADPDRMVSSRVQLVDLDHRPVTVPGRWGGLLGEVPITAAEVGCNGETSPSWTCTLTLTDPDWVPGSDITHPLHPLAPYRVAIWHRLRLAPGVWAETPLGVYALSEPEVTDEGPLTITVKGHDVIGVAQAGGYGAQVVSVGGMTSDAALRRLFSIVAPTVPLEVPPSTTVLPDRYELGRRKAEEDWKEIAALDGAVIAASRDGVLRAAPPPSTDTALRLVEDPRSPLRSVHMRLGGSMYNRVVVTGTHPDLTEPIWGMDEDDDPASPTWVGLGVRQLDIETDAATTAEACTAMARLHRARFRRPAEKLSTRIRPRPDIDVGDRIEVVRPRAGVTGVYTAQSWRMSLPIDGQHPDESMELVFDSQQQGV